MTSPRSTSPLPPKTPRSSLTSISQQPPDSFKPTATSPPLFRPEPRLKQHQKPAHKPPHDPTFRATKTPTRNKPKRLSFHRRTTSKHHLKPPALTRKIEQKPTSELQAPNQQPSPTKHHCWSPLRFCSFFTGVFGQALTENDNQQQQLQTNENQPENPPDHHQNDPYFFFLPQSSDSDSSSGEELKASKTEAKHELDPFPFFPFRFFVCFAGY